MCLSGVFLPWFCSGRVELYLGNISYLGRLNCRSTEETAAGGQGLVTAMVTLASGSGPADACQWYSKSFSRKCGVIRLFFF